MNRLKFKKFGWSQIKTVDDISLYDYIKNRMIIGIILIICTLFMTLTERTIKLTLVFICSFLIMFSIIYILISYEIIKKHYLFWYTISCVVPFILIFFTILFLLIQMNAVTASFFFFVLYILIFILGHILLKGYNKEGASEIKKSSYQLLIVPISAVSTSHFVYNHGDNIFVLMLPLLLLSTGIVVYLYYEMKYILKNHKDYK